MKYFFSTNKGIVVTGIVFGIVVTLLQYFGNPANMGLCIACFVRDIAGALKLHSVANLSYFRPEIFGIVIGASVASLIFKESRARGGSSPIIRFLLGVFGAMGALIFLGCPWRMILRIAGGDLNAVVGFLGIFVGIKIGAKFIMNGYSLGRAYKSKINSGFVFALIMIFSFALYYFLGPQEVTAKHAPIALSIVGGLVVGFLLQRSRLCLMGSLRDVFIMRSFHLLFGVVAFLGSAFICNVLLGQFHLGFVNQPMAVNNFFINFLAMTLSGLSFTLAGGCPGRQLVLASEGDNDAFIFVLGLLVGGALAHNLGVASSPNVVSDRAIIGIVFGLSFCLLIGFGMKEKFDGLR